MVNVVTDEALFEMLAKYAEGLNTTPIEVLKLFLQFGLLLGFSLGAFGMAVLDRLLDRLFAGLARLFHWFRSRRTTK